MAPSCSCGEDLSRGLVIVNEEKLVLPAPPPPPCAWAPPLPAPNENELISMSPLCLLSRDSPCTPSTLRNILPALLSKANWTAGSSSCWPLTPGRPCPPAGPCAPGRPCGPAGPFWFQVSWVSCLSHTAARLGAPV